MEYDNSIIEKYPSKHEHSTYQYSDNHAPSEDMSHILDNIVLASKQPSKKLWVSHQHDALLFLLSKPVLQLLHAIPERAAKCVPVSI